MTSIVKALRIKADIISLGEQIAWGSETELMRRAADRIEELEKALRPLEILEAVRSGKLR